MNRSAASDDALILSAMNNETHASTVRRPQRERSSRMCNARYVVIVTNSSLRGLKLEIHLPDTDTTPTGVALI